MAISRRRVGSVSDAPEILAGGSRDQPCQSRLIGSAEGDVSEMMIITRTRLMHIDASSERSYTIYLWRLWRIVASADPAHLEVAIHTCTPPRLSRVLACVLAERQKKMSYDIWPGGFDRLEEVFNYTMPSGQRCRWREPSSVGPQDVIVPRLSAKSCSSFPLPRPGEQVPAQHPRAFPIASSSTAPSARWQSGAEQHRNFLPGASSRWKSQLLRNLSRRFRPWSSSSSDISWQTVHVPPCRLPGVWRPIGVLFFALRVPIWEPLGAIGSCTFDFDQSVAAAFPRRMAARTLGLSTSATPISSR